MTAVAVLPAVRAGVAAVCCAFVKPRHIRESSLFAALLSALAMAAVGILGLWAGQPWLFPSLGPTIFILAVSPNEAGARPWNTLMGHAIGVAAGFGALFLFGAQNAPTALDADALSGGRVAATAVAVGMTVALQLFAKAQHPPAAATTMLITLGGLKPGWRTLLAIAVGVGLVAALGRGVRLLFQNRRSID